MALEGSCINNISTAAYTQQIHPYQHHALKKLMAKVPDGQQTLQDRSLLVQALNVYQQPRLLVFGCGLDSEFWAHTANAQGTTVFLEDNPLWCGMSANITSHNVKYKTAANSKWRGILNQGPERASALSLSGSRYAREFDILGVPEGLFEQWWDIILIDAPAGAHSSDPGRLAPIYQTSLILERQGKQRPCARVDVFVHDFERWTEREGSMLLLTPHTRLMNYGGLAQPEKRGWWPFTRDRSGTGGNPGATFLAWFHRP